ncbi:MAG: SDR family NAD(P)-dependent oxidoreductase [Chitinophagales bacterium]
MRHLFIITGTSRGIGLSLARLLGENLDNQIIGISRSHSPLHSENYIHIPLDLSKIEDVKKFEFPNVGPFQHISLVNNAGILGQIMPLQATDIDGIEDTFVVNSVSPMILIHNFLKSYASADVNKTIINISSGAATSAYGSWANYCSSKAALEMLTKCLNKEQEVEKYPTRIYSIAPGVVNTRMQEQIRNTKESEFALKQKFVDLYEKNQLFDPKYVAKKLEQILINPNKYNDFIFRIEQ